MLKEMSRIKGGLIQNLIKLGVTSEQDSTELNFQLCCGKSLKSFYSPKMQKQIMATKNVIQWNQTMFKLHSQTWQHSSHGC